MSVADPRPALRAFLAGDPAIAALAGTRIFPVKMPQGETQPSIVYTKVSDTGDYVTTGSSGLARPRMQITCWAQRHDQASALARAVKTRLGGYRGPMGADETPIAVQGAFLASERDQHDEDAGLMGVSQDYFLWFEEQ